MAICIFGLSTLVCKAQNPNATYYQIAKMGKYLYEISEKDNQLLYQKITFASGERVCLLAYDHENNNLLAVTLKNNLLSIDRTGKILKRQKLPIDSRINAFVISTTDSKGYLYVGTSSLNELYKINTNTLEIENLSGLKKNNLKDQKYRIHDMAYVKKSKSFLSVNDQGDLVSIKKSNLSITILAKLGLPKGVYGSIWYDGKNNLFAHHNWNRKIYSIDLKTKEAKLLDSAPFQGDWNDGTACFNVSKVKTEKENSNPIQNSIEIRHDENFSDIVLSPNPNNGIFKVSLDKDCSENVLIRVIDFSGKLIHQDTFVNNATIDLRKKYAATGTFIIQIVEDEVVIDTKKFIMNY